MSSTEIVDKKQEIRKALLEKRKALSTEEHKKASSVICDRLRNLEVFERADAIHIYLPIRKKKEVDTIPLIEDLFKMNKRVVVPVTEFDRIALHHVVLKNIADLKKNKWGVPEPLHQDPFDIELLDLVIVPMVGGDYHGNRIGYGKGYYDSFLKSVSCPKIGLLFDDCLVPELPVEEHDVKLDYLVTEKRVIH